MTRERETGLRIEDYAVVGDTRTMALIGRDGSVDWLCLPHFDSAACFAKLLGGEHNGRWQIVPKGWSEGAVTRTTRRYRPGSLVLETEWETATGVVRLVDAMPPRDEHVDLIRRVEGVHGEVEMAMRWVVRFAYGNAIPWVRRVVDEDGHEALFALAGPDAVVLRGDVLPEPDRREAHGAHHRHFTVQAGQAMTSTMGFFDSTAAIPRLDDPVAGIARTERFWAGWSSRSSYAGAYREAVERSLITLKAMTFEPTGGIVAAPTTSLPEQLGGTRNWDYRFCWLRDATLVILALLGAGYTEEAGAWRDWLLRAVAGSPEQLQILYGLSGERQLPELELDWLAGYEGSSPVRIGNAASEQFQLDVYGEVMSALFAASEAGLAPDSFSWSVQCAVMRHLETVMDRPDSGLWEVRGPERHFTFSKVMVWVAFDRAVRTAEEHGRQGPVEHWRHLRDQVHAEICAQAWNADVGAFTQYYGGDALDASLLVLPSVGFLPGDDPRVLSTLARIQATLQHGCLVDRYQTVEELDGLPPGEGSFLPCSFWLVTALAHAGRLDEARSLFEELLALRNDVGLLAEEYDGALQRMTGNFPQAFSHLTLVEAATTLDRLGSGAAPTGQVPGGPTTEGAPA